LSDVNFERSLIGETAFRYTDTVIDGEVA